MEKELGEFVLRREMLTLETVKMVKAARLPAEAQVQAQRKELEDEVEFMGSFRGTRTLELSNLDQVYNVYNDYSAVALFYDAARMMKGSILRDHDAIVNLITGALEELLLHLPTAAGRLYFNEAMGRTEIKYKLAYVGSKDAGADDWGVQFGAARANLALSELGDLSDSQPCFDLLYPSILHSCRNQHPPAPATSGAVPIIAIQVTTFTCGGFALAFKSHHAFADGYGAALILQNLCSIARGAGLAVPLQDDSQSRRKLMPSRVPPSPNDGAHTYFSVQRRRGAAPVPSLYAGGAASGMPPVRYAFSKAFLEALRRRGAAGTSNQAKQCSRYQALVALLWAARAKSLAETGCIGEDQLLALRIPSNMREKVPALGKGYVGNAILLCPVSATVQELCESPFPHIVRKVQMAMKANTTPEFMQSQTDFLEAHLKEGLVPRFENSRVQWLSITSYVSLPFYDTDCGWGPPVYCSSPSRQSSHVIRILDDPIGASWNVMVVCHSLREQASFHQHITLS